MQYRDVFPFHTFGMFVVSDTDIIWNNNKQQNILSYHVYVDVVDGNDVNNVTHLF